MRTASKAFWMVKAIVASILCAPLWLHAATLNITVQGDSVTYENANTFSGDIYRVTSAQSYAGLEPTNRWFPSATKTTQTLTLNGLNGETVSTNMTLHGFEYDWGGVSLTSSANTNTGLEPGFCTTSSTSSSTLAVYSTSSGDTTCASSIELNNAAAFQTPFFFVRPLFSVDDLMTALSGKPEGTYSATFHVSFKYYYYNQQSVLTYRTLSMPITLMVTYMPNILRSLNVYSPDAGVMEPEYTPSNVKGQTSYKVEATGYFNNGLKMQFDTSKDYQLMHEGGGNGATDKIPYYITCSTCSDYQQIVVDGTVTTAVGANSGVVTAPTGADKSTVNYELTIGYENRTIDQVKTGQYSDSFTVLFAVDL
ncbi:hypothetical protein [Vibrio hippocampi]|uniref:Fimbrial protein n=1 Tax=Vibrio hippocampi TaxID=654686 RepID=A0ABM8ZL62_9VIBR|nr:hypothetical protein [Vibrio hippocampi]CAH0527335.1 hypothetical protein VHP8226_02657 [Vibrio hippocampi]